MDERRHRGGTIAFIAAVSGLLTALAALLHAAGAFRTDAASRSGPVSVHSELTTAPPASSAPPSADATSAAASVQLNSSAQSQVRIVQGSGSNPLISECAAGDTSACATILNDLIDGCQNDNLKSCDALYAVSPVGSTLNTWAATCGARYSDESLAGRCAD